MNKLLAEHNGQIVETMNLRTGQGYPVIKVEKVNSRSRKSPPLAIPTFCPFCGTKYERE
ncbi:hypothetical protein [Telmatospirillum sp. J64-1]|uniref:hypothetical protein n=1 Tax=Telmatospirillum sp. J64-1 TaxID=2502183 RepID=UPI00163DC0A8|nr:hypothetical protein [Telmatospirillum sp. J64-1]